MQIMVSSGRIGCSFAAMTKFTQVLDSSDQLAIEEQESLLEVLQHRWAERRRAELVEAVKSARRQFKSGP
jgi:hypothetical protein